MADPKVRADRTLAPELVIEYFYSDRKATFLGEPQNGDKPIITRFSLNADNTLHEDGSISFASMHVAVLLALGSFLVSGLALATVIPPLPSLPILASLGVLALGYTVPPLKLCWRGLGEIDVGVTHSLGVILCGYAFQGGTWTNAWPWLVAVPLFFAILPAITLSGIPDYSADYAVGKGTIAVRLGPRVAVRVAQATTAVAAVMAVALLPRLIGVSTLAAIMLLIVPHAIAQVMVLERYLRHRYEPRRIDGLMVMALTYVLWFVGIPLSGLI